MISQSKLLSTRQRIWLDLYSIGDNLSDATIERAERTASCFSPTHLELVQLLRRNHSTLLFEGQVRDGREEHVKGKAHGIQERGMGFRNRMVE